jgi:transposase
MSKERDVRAAIIQGLRAGRTAREISDFNNISLRTVYNEKQRFDESVDSGQSPADVSSERKQHKRRSDARDVNFVQLVQEMISEDPGRSMRSMARELEVSDSTIRRVVEEDIRYKSYALRRGPLLNDVTRERRLEKAKLLLTRLKHPHSNGQLIFFSDEKNFSQEQKVNSQNDRWLCSEPEEVPVVMTPKFPATVMVLGVISSDGDVMPPHFFEKGQRITAEVYVDVLSTVVEPWMRQIAGDRHFIFQQDGAPAHTANKTQKWLREHLPEFWEKEVWPPNSPDCNPLDYFMWGVCERDVNKRSHNTVASVKAKVTEVMTLLDRNTIVRACKRFRSRVEAVIDREGGFFD